jgi:FMN-dependent oxidoreductase (nitrilotriacetate monooxygenase family)
MTQPGQDEKNGKAGRRRLLFNAFLTNSISHIHHGMWRHPASRQAEYTDLAMWTELARTLERGLFDTVFFADTLGTFDQHRGGWRTSVLEALQIPSGDPVVLLTAMAAVTDNLGFVMTSSILHEHPFTFARRASTLDHLTKGRFGWNIVTSTRRHEARNFGLDDMPAHAERYAWAEEYTEVVYALWEHSWEEGSVLRDKQSGRYTDVDKVHAINHRGPRYQVEGPHMAEPSPQRTPVLFQAGSSEPGRAFAARHAEATFIAAHDPTSAGEVVRNIRHRAMNSGRDQGDILFIQGLTFVVGSTESEARAKSREFDQWLSDEGMLAHMSGTIGVDLSAIDLDQPISDFTSSRVQGVVRSLAESAPDKSKTFGELARWAWSQRVVGTPEQIADQLERWSDAGVDGVNVIYITLPGTYVDLIDHVAPVLQERGLMQRDYRPGTLREKMFPGRGPRLKDSHPARQLKLSYDEIDRTNSASAVTGR